MFSKASDEWSTPQDFFDELNREFHFELDVAASAQNAKCPAFLTADDAWLGWDWTGRVCWMNPPYSKCYAFMHKASFESGRGAVVVALVPSRTDTRWWHTFVWNQTLNKLRPGIEVRFVKGRLKFGEGTNSAPFPSVVVIFRPPT
jgi:site-specific DNA-methyltransferase (adenine-specific)